MNSLFLLGRVLFAAIFLMSGPGHFSPQLVAYAGSQGVPAPWFLVPFSGIMATLGSLCLIFGWRTRLGAWLLIGFLIPVTFAMHRYWGLTDPAEIMLQRINFWKNMSMLGGAIAFAYFGGGPYSLDSLRATRRARPMRERERETILHQ